MAMSSSESDSSQKSSSEVSDNRIASAQDSVNLVLDRSTGNNLSLTQTDQGTVSAAFAFANKLAASAASQQAATTDAIQKNSTNALDAVKSAYSNFASELGDAYVTSKAGEQKVMVAAGLMIVGMVALKSLKLPK